MGIKVHVIFYSMYGHVYRMAEAVAAGVKEVGGAEATLFQAAEIVPDAILEKPIVSSAGFAVVQLKEKNIANKDDFAKDRLGILRGLRIAKAQDAVARYIASLRSKVKDKITFDQKLLEDGATDDSSDG